MRNYVIPLWEIMWFLYEKSCDSSMRNHVIPLWEIMWLLYEKGAVRWWPGPTLPMQIFIQHTSIPGRYLLQFQAFVYHHLKKGLPIVMCLSSFFPAGINSTWWEDARGLLKFIFFLAALHSMGDPNSPTNDQTHTPCGRSAGLTTGPPGKFLKFVFILFSNS